MGGTSARLHHSFRAIASSYDSAGGRVGPNPDNAGIVKLIAGKRSAAQRSTLKHPRKECASLVTQ